MDSDSSTSVLNGLLEKVRVGDGAVDRAAARRAQPHLIATVLDKSLSCKV
jgi:hypothetical protein